MATRNRLNCHRTIPSCLPAPLCPSWNKHASSPRGLACSSATSQEGSLASVPLEPKVHPPRQPQQASASAQASLLEVREQPFLWQASLGRRIAQPSRRAEALR